MSSPPPQPADLLSLPPDVLRLIMKRLPIAMLGRCMRACKKLRVVLKESHEVWVSKFQAKDVGLEKAFRADAYAFYRTATLGLRVAWPAFPPPFDLRLHLDVWHLLLMRFKSPIWSSFYFRHFNRPAGRGRGARERLHGGYVAALHKLRYIDTVCNVSLSLITSIAGVILKNNWTNYLMTMTFSSFFFGTALGATKGIDMSTGTLIIVLNEASLLAFVALQLWRTISMFRLTCFGILTATISALWAGFCFVKDVWPTKDSFAFGAIATVLVSAACSLSSSISITALAALLGYSIRSPNL